MMGIHAVALLSGGLDSTLAVKMMLDQGIEVTALNFTTPFCNCTAKSRGCKHEAVRVAKEFGIPIRVRRKGLEYLKVVENPRHGYGRGLNPCVDCRIFMHREARDLMEEEGARFLVTGEVLGQRPMSQRRDTLRLIEKESGTRDLVLRPLSARHFDPTLPEREGWVDRERLLAIEGRSRKEQIRLANDIGVTDYPCPAGGCLLTDRDFAAKLKDLFQHKPKYDLRDVRLLRIGRHFRLHPGLKIIVGRNQDENGALDKRLQVGETALQGVDFKGPVALAREAVTGRDALVVGQTLLRYAGVERGEIAWSGNGRRAVFLVDGPLSDDTLGELRIGAK